MRIDIMTGKGGTGRRQQKNNDALRFAPNFSVYLLPPDSVCLYSEARKFFLHGELYHALASAMGEGGKSARELVRALKSQFPADKVEEALNRLLERGYVVPGYGSNGTVAAYWASLGLPPQTAQENLRNCRLAIETIDVEGSQELSDALSAFGVRLVKRSPDLTFTVVGEYLDRRVAELN